MLKKLVSAVAVLSFLIAGAGEKRALRLDHLRTYVNKGQAAKFKPVSPNAELPLGSFIVLPDKSYPSYRLQVYHHDPANKEEYRRYTLKFTVSADVTLAGHLTFGLKPKNKKYSWYGNFSGSATRGFPLIPGTHQLTVEVDLKRQNLPDLGFVCPMINVTRLSAGSVTIDSLEVETMPSNYQPPKPPPVPKGPGLTGFTEQKNVLTHFKWDGAIALTKFTLMMDFTTLGLDIMQLTPANRPLLSSGHPGRPSSLKIRAIHGSFPPVTLRADTAVLTPSAAKISPPPPEQRGSFSAMPPIRISLFTAD